jgi:hypothetical protein
VTTEAKGVLDDWYVRNVSLWLDPRITETVGKPASRANSRCT